MSVLAESEFKICRFLRDEETLLKGRYGDGVFRVLGNNVERITLKSFYSIILG
jgi:hypothetical protein